MQFLTKLLRREVVSLADHVQALADLEADLNANFVSNLAVERGEWEQVLGIERDTVGRLAAGNRQLKADLATARAEAEVNKVDAEKYRRSRANLALGTAASAAKRKAAANGAPVDSGTF